MVSSSSNISVTCSPRCTLRFCLCVMTRARKLSRSLAYCSSDIRLSRVIAPILVAPTWSVSKSIGDPHQRDRMLLADFAGIATRVADALRDVAPGDGAVRADVVGLGLRHLAKHRS